MKVKQMTREESIKMLIKAISAYKDKDKAIRRCVGIIYDSLKIKGDTDELL